jgi:hypothetical protein
LHALLPELLKERLREIAPITKEFSKQRAYQLWQGIAIINVARRYFHSQQFPLVIDDQMQFETIKPTQAALSPSSKLCHHFMRSKFYKNISTNFTTVLTVELGESSFFSTPLYKFGPYSN